MRHPQAPKFRINQMINVPYSMDKGIIKGIRYIGETGEYDNNHHKFLTVGWEYQIYHWCNSKCGYINDRWSVWGWVTETEVLTINE